MSNYIQNMKKRNDNLSKYACNDKAAIRLDIEQSDIRTDYFRDIDRIIYSLAYTRYIDKTQVFSQSSNDNISKRMTHVQMVSRIGRTIGRALGLNEDLIEAASLGHDLGHVPFGHYGEKILNKISLEYNEGYFNHNVQSVRTLMYLEEFGKGRNITIQVLDAILCHNGEFVSDKYYPIEKNAKDFLDEYNNSYIDLNILKKLRPMTLEGCVVRISDVIAYIGRDIEDSIRLGVIKIEDVPKHIRKILGNTNTEIINNIVLDIIKNSINKPYIKISEDIFNAIIELKQFNYEKIYNKQDKKLDEIKIEQKFYNLFNIYLKQIENDLKNEEIYTVFLNTMDSDYLNNNTNVRKVIDYIAGMTDDYFLKQHDKYFGGREL